MLDLVPSSVGCDGHAIAQVAATWHAIAQAAVTWCTIAWLRGATPSPRSGAEAGRNPRPKGSDQEELPHVRGQGQWPRVPDCNGTGTAERSYTASKVRGVAERRYPVSEVRGGDERSYHTSDVRGRRQEEQLTPGARGGGREDKPQVQGAMAAWAQRA